MKITTNEFRGILLLIFFILLLLSFLALTNTNRNTQKSDYQLDISNDSIYLYDGNRHVGMFPISNDTLSTIILRDNE